MIAKVKFTATLWESERGWGRNIVEVKEFSTARARDRYIERINSKNTAPTAPDYYMFAEKGADRIIPIRGASRGQGKKRKTLHR